MTHSDTRYISSEHYRQMLVRDGDRRFQEWHSNFLRYQKQFLQKTTHTNSPSTVTPEPEPAIKSTVVPPSPSNPPIV